MLAQALEGKDLQLSATDLPRVMQALRDRPDLLEQLEAAKLSEDERKAKMVRGSARAHSPCVALTHIIWLRRYSSFYTLTVPCCAMYHF